MAKQIPLTNMNKHRTMKNFVKTFLIALFGGLVALGSAYLFNMPPHKVVSNNQTKGIIQTTKSLPIIPTSTKNTLFHSNNSSLPNLKTAAAKTVHAVVYIQTQFTRRNNIYDQYFGINDFLRNRNNSILRASGSGVIISSDGYIVTNNHVVQDADKISITLNDKRSYQAQVIGTNPETDLALLKIDAKNLSYIKFGNSDKLEVGDWVLAVGNPFNLTSTVTAGIISAKARNINILGNKTAIESFLQTDAVINPGNSGGALVNTKGELVGINAAIASRTGSYIGYSFAIPVSIVKKVVTDLKEYGSVQRAYIGVSIREVDAALAKELQLDSIKGVYIGSVIDNGAAANAGLEPGSIILSIDGMPVNSTSVLLEKIGLHRPGDKIKLDVLQDQKEKEFDLVLTNKYGTTKLDKHSSPNTLQVLGAEFKKPDNKLKQQLGIDYGLQVIKLKNGPLRQTGIHEGFIILKIGDKIIYTKQDIEKTIKANSGGLLIEGIYPNGLRAYYGIGI